MFATINPNKVHLKHLTLFFFFHFFICGSFFFFFLSFHNRNKGINTFQMSGRLFFLKKHYYGFNCWPYFRSFLHSHLQKLRWVIAACAQCCKISSKKRGKEKNLASESLVIVIVLAYFYWRMLTRVNFSFPVQDLI